MNDYQKSIEELLSTLKNNQLTSVPNQVEGVLPTKKKILMYVITASLLKDSHTIQFLTSWRDINNKWFPAQFMVTFDGTKKWAQEQLLEKSDRILFFLRNEEEKEPFGHIGLYRFNYAEKSCEIDNVIRGISSDPSKGGMTVGLQLLIDWTFNYLGVKKLYLQVFSDNTKAISLYTRLGFNEISRTPLVAKVHEGITTWVGADPLQKTNRYFVKMLLEKHA